MRKALVVFTVSCSLGVGAFSFSGEAAGLAAAFPVGPAISGTARAPAASNTASGVSGAAIVQYAMQFLGYPYTATGDSPSTGFSCIGFVSYVYRSLGINLPGDLGGAMAFARSVAFSDLMPGDILYFQNTIWPGLSHAAIYIGGGRFVHAEWYNRGVVVSSFTNDPVDGNYWQAHYLGANRPWAGVAAAASAGPPSAPAAPPAAPAPTAFVPRASTPTHHPAGPTALVRVPSLNVRAGPSFQDDIETAIPRGTRLVLLGARRGWYRVALPDGARGWVVGAGIGRGLGTRQALYRSGASGGSRPRSIATRRPAARARRRLAGLQVRATALVLVNGLRIHSAPSLGAPIVGSASRGQVLAVMRATARWSNIRLPNGSVGWIVSQFVQRSGHRTPGAGQAIHKGTRRTRIVTAPSGGGSSLTARTKVALNVRQGPSLSAAILSVLPPGVSYRVIGWSNGWAHVRLSGGGSGWISGTVAGYRVGVGGSSPARHAGAARSGSASSGAVVTVGARLRASPGLGSLTLGLVAAGTHVTVLGSRAGWTKVRLPSREVGYILGSYVQG